MKIGLDLGGTKIEAIVLDDAGSALWRERRATPQGDYTATLEVIEFLVNKAKCENDLPMTTSVGIGTPGALSAVRIKTEAVMKNSNSTALNGRPLLSDLSARLKCRVYLANDANCFALAEACSGQGPQYFKDDMPESVFGVILGTGVGGGIVVNGRLLAGSNAIAGEWGHNCLPAIALNELAATQRGRDCYCGRKDCIETYLSGPGLALSYVLKYQEPLSPEQIIEKMRAGDAKAVFIWEQYLAQLACSLAQIVNVLDPALIVLGGGLSTISEIYGTIVEKMRPHVFSDTFNTPMLPALLGDSAGVFGAAWLNPA
jgi:fructokinase